MRPVTKFIVIVDKTEPPFVKLHYCRRNETPFVKSWIRHCYTVSISIAFVWMEDLNEKKNMF